MNEILKLLNALTADELDSVLMRGGIMLEKKRKEEAEAAIREQERIRLEKIEQEKKRLEEIAELQRKIEELQKQKIVIPEAPGSAVTGDNFVMHDAPKTAAPAAAAKSSDTIECPHCHRMNKTDRQKCWNCDRDLYSSAKPQTPEMVTCPHCHKTNAPGRTRCWDCGKDLYASAQPEQSAKPQAPEMVACPHCKLMNIAGSQFCANCGQRINIAKTPAAPQPEKPKPAKIFCPHCRSLNDADSVFCASCGQRMESKAAAQQPKAPVQQPQAQASTAQVRFADESMKKWELMPGEETKCNRHAITLLQPDTEKKFAYYMEVTNKRILLTREGNFSKNMGLAGALGGGLVGGLLMEGVKAAAGAGPKPWLEIPLTAVSNCGLQGKKEFFIVADQTYVLKNFGYEKFLPALVAEAKK